MGFIIAGVLAAILGFFCGADVLRLLWTYQFELFQIITS